MDDGTRCPPGSVSSFDERRHLAPVSQVSGCTPHLVLGGPGCLGPAEAGTRALEQPSPPEPVQTSLSSQRGLLTPALSLVVRAGRHVARVEPVPSLALGCVRQEITPRDSA